MGLCLVVSGESVGKHGRVQIPAASPEEIRVLSRGQSQALAPGGAGDVDAVLDDAGVDTSWRNRFCGSPSRYLPGRVGGHPPVRGVSMLVAFGW